MGPWACVMAGRRTRTGRIRSRPLVRHPVGARSRIGGRASDARQLGRRGHAGLAQRGDDRVIVLGGVEVAEGEQVGASANRLCPPADSRRRARPGARPRDPSPGQAGANPARERSRRRRRQRASTRYRSRRNRWPRSRHLAATPTSSGFAATCSFEGGHHLRGHLHRGCPAWHRAVNGVQRPRPVAGGGDGPLSVWGSGLARSAAVHGTVKATR
jgi:hypothetical protein